MMSRRLLHASVVIGVFVASSLAAAAEPTAVTVDLSDAGNARMSLTLKPNKVPAGPVEFTIKNQSHSLKHEFMLLRWSDQDTALPYDKKTQQVEEDKLKALRGVEDLNPHEAVTARFVLTPGRYLVFCNEPGHYRDGMRADLIVVAAK